MQGGGETNKEGRTRRCARTEECETVRNKSKANSQFASLPRAEVRGLACRRDAVSEEEAARWKRRGRQGGKEAYETLQATEPRSKQANERKERTTASCRRGSPMVLWFEAASYWMLFPISRNSRGQERRSIVPASQWSASRDTQFSEHIQNKEQEARKQTKPGSDASRGSRVQSPLFRVSGRALFIDRSCRERKPATVVGCPFLSFAVAPPSCLNRRRLPLRDGWSSCRTFRMCCGTVFHK